MAAQKQEEISNTDPSIKKSVVAVPADQAPTTKSAAIAHTKKRDPLPVSTLALLLFFGVILIFAQLFFYRQMMTSYTTYRAVREQERTQQEAHLALASQLDRYAQAMEQINAAFLDETSLIELVGKINARLQRLSSGQLKFDTGTPVKIATDQYPHLPVTITASGNREDLWKLIDDLAQNPYLIVPQDIDIAMIEDPPSNAKLIMRARLYVNDTIQN